jgi:NTP pyrophosphatase (non-canonical NTP hydrolase)
VSDERVFTDLLSTVARRVWQTSEDKGFHAARLSAEYPELAATAALGLIASEVGEAVEAVRTGGGQRPATKTPNHTELGEELADLVIRVLDLAYEWDINLGGAILDKMTYNAGRPQMHGKSL